MFVCLFSFCSHSPWRIGLGNKLAAAIGSFAEKAGEKLIFTGIFIFCTLIALLVILLLKQLKKLTHGAEELQKI